MIQNRKLVDEHEIKSMKADIVGDGGSQDFDTKTRTEDGGYSETHRPTKFLRKGSATHR